MKQTTESLIKNRKSSELELLAFIEKTENSYFRTDGDIGANWNALIVWNQVRKFAGLKELDKDDLPTYCDECNHYHVLGTGCIKEK